MSAAAEQFFRNHAALPTMPEVASRLMRSFDDDRISLGAISELIAKDSTLTAKVLRLANSARYSPSHQIDHLQDAAAALGLETLRNLSLGACISCSFPNVQGLDRKVFWRHSIATANYARIVSRLLELDADSAYLAGLMLRTGQILMALAEPAKVADVEAHAVEPGSRFSLEMSRFGCSHADVTAALAGHWHFPAAMVQAFRDAQAPLDARPFSRMAAVLHIAEVLADAAEHHDRPGQALQVAVPELVEHLHLDLAYLEERLAAAGDVAADVDQMIG
ncbi:MAG: HDOD domain-containing protein [Burkholderiaceae bacterium]